MANFKNYSKTKESNTSFFDSVIETILNIDLQEWEHFAKNAQIGFPYNPISNVTYKGSNVFYLILSMVQNGYSTPNFATYNQIVSIGGNLKGQKSTPIQKYIAEYVNKKNPKKKISPAEYKELTKEEKENYIFRAYLKNFFLFNFDQINNINDIDLSKLDLAKNEDLTQDFETDQDIEEWLKALQDEKEMKIERRPIAKACYFPMSDYIQIPTNEIFKNEVFYYSTTFHEIIHWTGNVNRLDRLKLSRFGSKDYAFEELVAEIGAMLLCFDFGIVGGFFNSCAYLKSWLNKTEHQEKSKILENAFILSQQAVKFLK